MAEKKEAEKKPKKHKKGLHMGSDLLPKGKTGIIIERGGIKKRLEDIVEDNQNEE